MRRLASFLVFVPLLTLSCASGGGAATGSWTFDEDAVGGVPDGWEVAETNGRGTTGAWRVREAQGSTRYVSLETTNTGHTYNLLLAPASYGADLTIRTRVRAESGREDQGGGVVWRARDASNYYVTRWNPLEDNLRAYKVVDSVRTQLASVEVKVPAGWHPLSVQAEGKRIVIRFGDDVKLELEDSTFADGGRVGLWTKADAATSFDDFEVESR